MFKSLAYFLVLCAVLRAQDGVDCKQRTLIVNAIDYHGLPVQELTTENLRATYNSRQLKILSLAHKEETHGRVVVLLDTSGSMNGTFPEDPDKWKIAKAAVSEFLSSAPKETGVSFMTFAADIGKTSDSSLGRQAVLDWLQSNVGREGKDLKGRTALYEAILTAKKSLEPVRQGDAIYVVTDGGENASRDKSSMVERILEDSGLRLFVFILTGPHLFPPEEGLGPRELLDLTRNTGGSFVSVHPNALNTITYNDQVASGVRTYTQVIEAEISNYYVLIVQLPNGLNKPEPWKIEVVDTQGHTRKNVTVTYPHKLAICALQPK
jgi:von Willebrand factor type A domain